MSTNEEQYNRRATDVFKDDASPQNLLKLLKEIRETQIANEIIQRAHTKAFILNDIGEPDYDGHRKSHLELEKTAKLMQEYKQDATKKIISSVAVFLLGVFAMGFLEYAKMKLGIG